MAALGINLGYLIFQLLNFTIVMVLLYALAYKPIVKALETRKEKIAQSLEDARIAAEARANAEEDARAIIAKAQAEAADKVRGATQRADQVALEVKAAAEADAVKIREDATAEAVQERDRILGDLRGQIASLAMAATQKLVSETLDEKRQHAILDDFFSGIKAGKVTMLEDVSLQGATAEVTSALPLSDNEKEIVRKGILSKIGVQKVSFRVNPAILGGLVVKVGDKVLDGSVAGQLETMRQSLS
jgi:F-type H+-transporting ATPase subunit b